MLGTAIVICQYRQATLTASQANQPTMVSYEKRHMAISKTAYGNQHSIVMIQTFHSHDSTLFINVNRQNIMTVTTLMTRKS
jgi:hypothetical protein